MLRNLQIFHLKTQKKKKKIENNSKTDIPHRVYNYRKIGAYIEKEKEKRKQFSNRNNNPSSTKLPIFQKIPKREKYTHTHTHRDATIIDQNDWQSLPPSGGRAIGAGGKGSGRKIKWCNGKKVRQREREHGGGLSRRRCARAHSKWRMAGIGEDVAAAFSVSVETLASRVWPAADLSSPYTAGSSFCPSVNRLSCTTNGLPYPQRGERRRTVNWGCGPRWGREVGCARMLGGRWIHLVARHDYATAIDLLLLVPIVETSCSPRCRIKSWMCLSLRRGQSRSRGMADFTISCLV